MHTVQWDGVRVFLAVARAGRVSIAARQLGVEHTTVSRRLAALEDQLGAPLFYRTARGYLLTPNGERVMSQAEAMERAALAIETKTAAEELGLAGRVRVALLPELASHWLAPALPAFRDRHPAIDLQIVAGVHTLDLSRGEADLAVRTPRPRQQGLATVRLASCPVGVYAAKSLLGRKRPRITDAASARGLPFAVYSPEYHVLQGAAWFQPALEAATIVARANSSDTLLGIARSGVGFAVVPRFMARRYPQLVSVSDDVHSGEMWLTTHPELRREPRVRAVSTFLREIASDLT